MQYLQYSRLQKFWNYLLTTFIPFLNLQTWTKFSIISSKHNLYSRGTTKRITSVSWHLKQNNGKISFKIYGKPLHTDQYLHCNSHLVKSGICQSKLGREMYSSRSRIQPKRLKSKFTSLQPCLKTSHQPTLTNLSLTLPINLASSIPPPLFVIFIKLMSKFSCIDFRSTILSWHTILVVAISHAKIPPRTY